MSTKSEGLPQLDRQTPDRVLPHSVVIDVRLTLVQSLLVFEHIAKTKVLKESADAQLLTLIAKIKEVLKWI